jgi:SAM-dependent methyltransferase
VGERDCPEAESEIAAMKYYVPEHLQAYRQIADTGKTSWDELHGSQGFEDATIRHLLAIALPHCTWESSAPRALEYGCGTGPGACYLAEHGFQVTGIDLNPVAIALAQQEATRRNLNVHYAIGDVCALQGTLSDIDSSRYDLIVDSFCLQSIVTDADRAALLRFVKSHLDTNGYYLICTAGYSAARRYDDAHFDPKTGMVYIAVNTATGMDDVVEIDGKTHIPYRRHLRVAELTNELAAFNFVVVWQQVDTHGNIALLCIA